MLAESSVVMYYAKNYVSIIRQGLCSGAVYSADFKSEETPDNTGYTASRKGWMLRNSHDIVSTLEMKLLPTHTNMCHG